MRSSAELRRTVTHQVPVPGLSGRPAHDHLVRWSVLTLRTRLTYSFVVFLALLLSPTFGLTVLLWRSVLLIVLLS